MVLSLLVLILRLGVDFWWTEERFDSDVTLLIRDILRLLMGEIGSVLTIWSRVNWEVEMHILEFQDFFSLDLRHSDFKGIV